MAQITKRGLENNSVDGSKIALLNNDPVKARNNANTSYENLHKLNTSDVWEFLKLPQYSGSNVATENHVSSNYIPLSQKGAANGVAELDANGKIPSSQLTVAAMEYLGNHDVSTNSPTLVDGVGNTGDMYNISVAGSRDYGSGTIDLEVNDKIAYNGSVWEKWQTSDFVAPVTSVAGKTGAVTLDTDDVSEAGNLYFTDSRARTAAVVDSMAGSETDQAPSVSSVKSYVDGNYDAVTVETFTLSAGDITNGYITLTQNAENILSVVPKGFPPQHPGDDFINSPANRITFAGDMLSLNAGDKVNVAYTF